jgi:hypothetical protein
LRLTGVFIENEGLGFGRHSKLIWTKKGGFGHDLYLRINFKLNRAGALAEWLQLLSA